jgi:hypothetical protein
MDFKTYYLDLSQQDRADFAEKIGTTTGYCHQLAYGDKRIELGLADAMVAVSGGALTLLELNLTDRAVFQANARRTTPQEEPAQQPAAAGV